MRLSTQVYKQYKEELMQEMHWSKDYMAERIRGQHVTGTQEVYGQVIGLNLTTGKQVIDNHLIDLWDMIWFYSRELHAVLPEPEYITVPQSGVDTSILKKLDKDVTLDVMLNDRQYYIHLANRNVPVNVNGYTCDWTIQVTDDCFNTISFHFKCCENVRKVYLTTCDYAESGSCIRCGKVNCNGVVLYRRSLFKDDCRFEKHWRSPIYYLVLMLEVVQTYVNREKRFRKKPEELSFVERSLMIATPDNGEETVRPIPIYDYVKEYREASRNEYKGGTHKSPVCHPRSAYYRRCKHGSYILKDGEFIPVPKGMGKFCKVKSTIVNAYKDATIADML